MNVKLKVGKRYKLRGGAVIEVTSVTHLHTLYPVLSFDVVTGEIQTGRAFIRNQDHPEDIVEEVHKPREFWLGIVPTGYEHCHLPEGTFHTSYVGSSYGRDYTCS